MHHDRLVSGLAAVLGAITVVMAVLGVAYNPAILFVALTFGVATYFVYYHASGRMAASVYRRVERQAARNDGSRGPRGGRSGGFGAGPREDWTPPRDGATAGDVGSGSARRRRSGGSGGRQRRQRGGRTRYRQRPPGTRDAPATATDYRTLDLEPGADEAAVKRAYREKVKSVHPDAEGGDEETFKAVTAAYERLTD